MPDTSDSNDNTLVPPQLPKFDEVDKDIGLKYLDTYQIYVSAHLRSYDDTDKKKRSSVSSNSDVSIAPSMSASHRGQAIPAVVRVDSRESCLSYTPPNLPSEFAGLIIDDRNNGPGFCYLGLVKPEHRENVKNHLGRYPTFGNILETSRHFFLEDHLLLRLQISNVAPMHYHVVTGTIMPNVTSTLTAIVEKSGLVPSDNTTLCYWASRLPTREGLVSHAPNLDDILGSSRAIPRQRYQNPSIGFPGSGYTYPPQYIYPLCCTPSYYIPSRYMYPSNRYPPTINYEYREPRSTRSSRSRGPLLNSDTTDDIHPRLPIVEPRRDRSYHQVSNRSTRRRERSPPEQLSRSYNRQDNVTHDRRYSNRDEDLERTRHASTTEYRYLSPTPRSGMYNFDDIRESLDTASQDLSPSRRTTGASQVSSAASTSSIRVYGSLQGATCNICTDVIGEGAGVLPCGHVFHSNCVDTWLSEHNTCPQCRAQI